MPRRTPGDRALAHRCMVCISATAPFPPLIITADHNTSPLLDEQLVLELKGRVRRVERVDWHHELTNQVLLSLTYC